jgi:hypothetical protein
MQYRTGDHAVPLAPSTLQTTVGTARRIKPSVPGGTGSAADARNGLALKLGLAQVLLWRDLALASRPPFITTAPRLLDRRRSMLREMLAAETDTHQAQELACTIAPGRPRAQDH